jgi:hypothetical protein
MIGILLVALADMTTGGMPAIKSDVIARAKESSLATVERQFRELPIESRRLTGPLFWLHGDDSKDRLEMFVEKVAEGGNGTLTTESRPHNDWLGPNWFRDVGICLNAAKKHGLKLWIFDEQWWPSQSVAGKVPERYAAKKLEASSVEVKGPDSYQSDGFAGSRHVGAIAGRITSKGEVEGRSLVDLAPFIRGGKLSWQVPAGRWQIMKFSYKTASPLGQNGQLSVDGMSRDCVEWFLRTVYQPHYDHFKDDFGKTIEGFFYDEPETRGDWGTELNHVLNEQKVDWKKAYVGYKFRLAGEEQIAARYQYLDARAETWGRTMYGLITRWCEDRGVKSIGHFMEHGNLYLNEEYCAGDVMRVQKYSSMGGIDAVFSQFKPGQRAAYDAPCWQTPKMGSSITHAYGKPDDVSMVEIFGARGQDLTYPEMKWWTDAMQVAGVNFLIPHSFNPRAPYDTDCPPYFYMGEFEPRWPLYRVFADYTSRLSLMLTGGRHVAPVALLTPGQSADVGKRITVEQVSESLQDALYDCDWIPYEVFENDIKPKGKLLQLRQEAYQILVLPAVEVIPYTTLAKAKAFFEKGGVVVTYGFLPTVSATLGKTSADIARLRNAIWGATKPGLAVCKQSANGGRSYLLPAKPTPEQLQQVFAKDAGIHPTLEVIKGKIDHWLHVLHRVKSGRDVFFVANQNHEGSSRSFRFRVHAKGEPECWDAMRNEISAVNYRRIDSNTVEIDMVLEPLESVLLVFQNKRRALPLRTADNPPKSGKAIELVREATPQTAKMMTSPWDACSWVWYPEGNPAVDALSGHVYFRGSVTLPSDQTVKAARFVLSADNEFSLWVNGQESGSRTGQAEAWRTPETIDIASKLKPGVNHFAILGGNLPGVKGGNPAGLIGHYVIEFETGKPVVGQIDTSWKSMNREVSGWLGTDFDDSGWPAAMLVARHGEKPWGRLDEMTLSPAKADPYLGRCQIPSGFDPTKERIFLEVEGLAPEAAASVKVNGAFAGGFIGRPLRLDVTRLLQKGSNTILIEPFAPQVVRLVVYKEKVSRK